MESSDILARLVEMGKITQEDIDNATVDKEEEIRATATTLHSLICEEEHMTVADITVGKPGCYFYAEESLEDTWKHPTHNKWLGVARKYSEYYTTEDLQDVTAAIRILNKYGVNLILEFVKEINA